MRKFIDSENLGYDSVEHFDAITGKTISACIVTGTGRIILNFNDGTSADIESHYDGGYSGNLLIAID